MAETIPRDIDLTENGDFGGSFILRDNGLFKQNLPWDPVENFSNNFTTSTTFSTVIPSSSSISSTTTTNSSITVRINSDANWIQSLSFTTTEDKTYRIKTSNGILDIVYNPVLNGLFEELDISPFEWFCDSEIESIQRLINRLDVDIISCISDLKEYVDEFLYEDYIDVDELFCEDLHIGLDESREVLGIINPMYERIAQQSLDSFRHAASNRISWANTNTLIFDADDSIIDIDDGVVDGNIDDAIIDTIFA